MAQVTGTEHKSLFYRFPWVKRLTAAALVVALLVSLGTVGAKAKRKESLPTTDEVSLATAPPKKPAPVQQQPTPVQSQVPPQTDAQTTPPPGEAAPQPQTDPFVDAIGRVDEALAAGDYRQAAAALDESQALATDDNRQALVLVQRGKLAYYQEHYQKALGYYVQAQALKQEVFTPADLYFTSARCRLLLQDAQGAKGDCDKGIAALTADQQGPELFVLRGTAGLYLEEYDKAIADFEMAKQRGYSDPGAVDEQIALCRELSKSYVVTDQGEKIEMDEESQLSLTYYALGMYAEAAAAYTALLEKGSTYYTKAQLYACIAKCYIFLAQYDKAIEAVTAGLALNETEERDTLSALRGTAEMASGQYVQAAKSFQDAIDSGYEKPRELFAQSAACYYYAGVFREAVRCGEAALKDAEKDTEAALWVALSYYQMEDYPKAVLWLERTLAVEQVYCEKSELRRCLTRSYLLLGQYQKVLEVAGPALTPTAGHPVTGKAAADTYALRGAAYLSLSDYRGALADFYAAVALGYADPYELYRQCTLCHFLLGEYDKAVASGQRALDNGTGNGELYYWIGISYFSLGKYGQAEQSLKHVAELDPTQKNLDFYLGVCRFSEKDYKAAIEYFTSSAEKGETKEKCVYNRALCYLELEEYKLARQDLEASAAQTVEVQVAADAAELLKSIGSILPAK